MERYFDPEPELPLDPDVVGAPSGVFAPGVAWSVGAPSAPPVMVLPDDEPLPAPDDPDDPDVPDGAVRLPAGPRGVA